MPFLVLLLTIALAAGLAAGVTAEADPPGAARALLAAAWALGALAWGGGWRRGQLAAALMAAMTAGWLLGGAAVSAALHPPLRLLLEQRFGGFAIEERRVTRLGDPIVVEGRLTEDAAVFGSGVGLRLAVTRVWLGKAAEPVTGGLSVVVSGVLAAGEAHRWTAGRLVRAPVLIRRPARYLNPGVPDGERALARRGIALVGTIKSGALVEVVGTGPWWDELAAGVRRRTRDALGRWVAVRDGQAGAVAIAILIGDRASMTPEVERRLQEAGTYHVVAISGGNIAVFAALVLGVLTLAGAGPATASAGAIAGLIAYATVAAGGASVARATVMAVVYLAVRLIDQRTAAANAVALTAAVLLVFDPLTVVDVGFWLTLGATSAILLGAGRLSRPAGVWRHGAALLAASIAAEVALLPIAASVFQRVTVAGLALNFIAIPAMTAVQLAAMATVLCDTLGLQWPASACGWVTVRAARVLLESGRLVDLAPWLAWRVPPPALTVVAAYYAAIAAWWWAARPPIDTRRRRWLARTSGAATVLLGLWIAICPPARMLDRGDGRLHFAVIDVGQGESLLVRFPNGRRLLMDAGGLSFGSAFDVGDRVVGPALRARLVTRIDYLALSHGDPDHMGGALSVLRDFAPAEVWEGVEVPPHVPTAELRAAALAGRAAWRRLQTGDHLAIGGVEVRLHHPPLPDWERQEVRNDDSLVVELRYGDVSMLLTGDIGREVEAALLPTLDLLPLVVLKVAHHGSGTSTSAAFLDHVRPAVALISAGRANSYGHPVPSVLARLRRAGAEVFRTDQDGAIDVSTDGHTVEVVTFTGRKRR